jgi:diguanylate cyclase (GGDEF)-like protein/PAS domain S-box-containing protein
MPKPDAPDPLRRAQSILEAVAFGASALAGAPSWRAPLGELFERLGRAAGASRVYLFANVTLRDGSRGMSQVFEWVEDGIEPTIQDPENQDFPYASGYERWESLMAAGDVVHGIARDMPAGERADLESEDILSIASVPVFVGEEWWGFLGFDDCVEERDWTELEIQALRAAAGTIGSAIERDRITSQLIEAETRFRTHVEHLPAITYIEYTDADNRLGYSDVYVSPQIESILGYTQEWWLRDRDASAWNEVVHPDDRERVEEEARRTSFTKEPYIIEYRVRRRDGTWAWVRDEAFLFEGEPGGRPYWHGVIVDITDRKMMEEQLRQAEERYRTLVEQIPAVLYVEPVAGDEDLAYVSPQVEHVLGCSTVEWLRSKSWWHDHIHPDDRDLAWELHVRNRESETPEAQEYRMVRDDGREVWIRDEPKLLRRDDGRPWLIQGLLHDITERKKAQEEIEFLAYHDKLTGLANRALFEAMMEPAMARARRRNLAVAVLFMDLDGFKEINDTRGHDVGDRLLQEVAIRLTQSVRETDLVCRQGGDEFLVLLADLELDGDGGEPAAVGQARTTAERIHAAMRAPFSIGGTDFRTTASIGISVFPIDAEDERALLKNADEAMYESKKGRRGGAAMHDEAGDRMARLSPTRRLREAVRNQNWVLHYLPVVDLKSRRMVGVEALLRWRRQTGGLVPPGDFLPMAEEMGLLEIIGEWVVDEVCAQAKAWRGDGLDLTVSFNLSPRQLWRRDLAEGLARSVDEAGIPPPSVVVEIQESTALMHPERTGRVLKELHDRGLRVAIDDFGSGYAHPSRLRHVPVDILKIDQPLVRDVPGEPDVSEFVRAAIDFSVSQGIHVLAEGIETASQLRFLEESGCELGQGYYFCRPVPAALVAEVATAGTETMPGSVAT